MLDTTVATVTYFAECSLERWKSLCATKPTIRPIHNLRINVLGALVTYAVDKSLIKRYHATRLVRANLVFGRTVSLG